MEIIDLQFLGLLFQSDLLLLISLSDFQFQASQALRVFELLQFFGSVSDFLGMGHIIASFEDAGLHNDLKKNRRECL
jgi:hypothetical protein